MELFVTWCSFIGSWFLFAGPVYQAAIELKEENIEDDLLSAAHRDIVKPPAVSEWWWLFPPARIILERKREREIRKRYFEALSLEDIERLMSFINKSTGWLFVASGGLLIAVKETYELTVALHLHHWVFWLTIVVLIIVAVGTVATRIHRSEEIIARSRK